MLWSQGAFDERMKSSIGRLERGMYKSFSDFLAENGFSLRTEIQVTLK